MSGYRSRCSVAFQLGRFADVHRDGLGRDRARSTAHGIAGLPGGSPSTRGSCSSAGWLRQFAIVGQDRRGSAADRRDADLGARDDPRTLYLPCRCHARARSIDLLPASMPPCGELAEGQIALAAQHGFAQDLAAGRFDLAGQGTRPWCCSDEATRRHGRRDPPIAGTGAYLGVPAQLADLGEAPGGAKAVADQGAALVDEALLRAADSR